MVQTGLNRSKWVKHTRKFSKLLKMGEKGSKVIQIGQIG